MPQKLLSAAFKCAFSLENLLFVPLKVIILLQVQTVINFIDRIREKSVPITLSNDELCYQSNVCFAMLYYTGPK